MIIMNEQITNSIFMVRPVSFGYNLETGQTNAFQKHIYDLNEFQISSLVTNEFDGMVSTLRQAGIEVIVIDDNKDYIRPDAIFPNNWISLHSNGMVITYPLQSQNRRTERRDDIIETLSKNFRIEKRLSLEVYEKRNQYLEGTGSMVFDHSNKIIFACLSPRTDLELLIHYSDLLKYKLFYFNAFDEANRAIYHTNVMMAIGIDFVVICLRSIEENKRSEIIKIFEKTDKEIIDISFDQMNHFAGNMLQLFGADNTPFLVMSQTAYDSLFEEQRTRLLKRTNLLPVKIDIIETIGGGSARCMMAEIFLPKI